MCNACNCNMYACMHMLRAVLIALAGTANTLLAATYLYTQHQQ
jgi:hypothetical protein